jgi:hypothetical protein
MYRRVLRESLRPCDGPLESHGVPCTKIPHVESLLLGSMGSGRSPILPLNAWPLAVTRPFGRRLGFSTR